MRCSLAYCRYFILSIGATVMAITCYSQTLIHHLGHLQPPKVRSHKDFPIDHTPFGTIRVLDSRPDTVLLINSEDGNYPPEETTFDTTTAIALRQYLQALADQVKTGKETLVINLRELYVPNQRFILRRVKEDLHVLGITQRKAGSTWAFDERSRIEFAADLYYETGSQFYRKLFSIKNEYYCYGNLKDVVQSVLKELLVTASVAYSRIEGSAIEAPRRIKQLLKDTSVFSYDHRNISLEEVKRDARESWQGYPIMRAGSFDTGLFRNFDDFRENKVSKEPVQLRLDGKDSVYRLVSSARDSLQKVFGVSDGKYLYIQVAQNAFLQLQRTKNEFCFIVPRSMPDMYALLSIMDQGAGGNIGPYGW